jgi:APA family basic amino acid/polyamine antiporter
VAFARYLNPLLGLPAGYVDPSGRWRSCSVSPPFTRSGIKPGAVLINVITFGKTVAIALLVSWRISADEQSGLVSRSALRRHIWREEALSRPSSPALVPVMFSYGGWQNVNFVAEEVRDPLRNLPRAILIGVLCVIVVYVGANIAYLHVLSAPALAATETPAADMAVRLLWCDRGED